MNNYTKVIETTANMPLGHPQRASQIRVSLISLRAAAEGQSSEKWHVEWGNLIDEAGGLRSLPDNTA